MHGGTYRIVRFINSGGFGCTYEAKHVMLDKRVAIKEFFVKDFCNRDETTAHVTVGTQSKKGLVEKLRFKFVEEAKAISRLEQPGIVRVSDVFEENGTAYYVMDYIDGLSLSEIVKRDGPLTEKRALKYIRQVGEALQYVHEHNRLHLDVKPGNIMINAHDDAVLIDFGASKQYDEVDGENTSTLLGKTPGYAPPEQMGNNVVKFTPATDIYALGATLYKLLTGITPPSATLLISGDEQLAPLPKGTSEGVRKAIAAAMQLNKKERPQRIVEFLKNISGTDTVQEQNSESGDETVIDAEDVKVNTADYTSSVAETKEPVKKRKLSIKPVVTIAGICVVVAAVIFALVKMGILIPESELDKLMKEAESGDASAQYDLALHYFKGDGVTQSHTEAVKWFRKAAEQGNVYAQTWLGWCYRTRNGITQDDLEAVNWYRKAAEQGYADAQYFLGAYYEKEGDRVNQKAVFGHYYLGVTLEEKRNRVTPSYTEAAKWYRKAAEQGHIKALKRLCFFYKNVIGVTQSDTEAVKWYTKAADQGVASAQYNLGNCYEEGKGVTQSDTEAVKWYRNAALQGNKNAKEALTRLGYSW